MARLKKIYLRVCKAFFSHFMHLLIHVDSLFLLLFADRLAVGRLPLPTSRCHHRLWQSNCFPRFLPKQSINTIHFCGLPSPTIYIVAPPTMNKSNICITSSSLDHRILENKYPSTTFLLFTALSWEKITWTCNRANQAILGKKWRWWMTILW